MNIVEQLDLAIKKKETGTTEGSYKVCHNGITQKKQTYMTNAEWKDFLNNMIESARKEYAKGGGDELSEKNGRPPKMASYGSSSRMIYNLSKANDRFHYEEQLSTTVGGKANLDGFCKKKDDSGYIFVEAKCHEPYSIKKNSVSPAYEGLYKYINEHYEDKDKGKLIIEMQPSKCGRYMNIEYFVKGERIERFDIKQMICHLLGIATGVLSGRLKEASIDFIYLLYDPRGLDISKDAKTEIDRIYERTCLECGLIDFRILFGTILEFLRKEKKFEGKLSDESALGVTNGFSFALMSQEEYMTLINETINAQFSHNH